MLQLTSALKLGIVACRDPWERQLRALYAEQIAARPRDEYIRRHALPEFAAGSVAVFRWYQRFLPDSGAILDWGCRHAPDSCLLKMEYGDRYQLHGCDLESPEAFRPFHQFANLKYVSLEDIVRIPYPDQSLDAVIATGVLEHVARDYDSLRELHRILKPEGRLIISYLPNRLSLSEWRVRNISKTGFHRRLYGLREAQRMLLHFGFDPLEWGYQSRLDLLNRVQPVFPPLRAAARLLGLHHFTSGLCLAARRVQGF
jgi:SAM-dependent methyltransferase